jgi:hypothetical protein
MHAEFHEIELLLNGTAAGDSVAREDQRFSAGRQALQVSLHVEGAAKPDGGADRAICLEAPGLFCAAVFDGAGTPPRDAAAADAAVAALRKHLNHRSDRDCEFLLKRMDEAVRAAGGGTVSASILLVRDNAAMAITAGDTQAWSLGEPLPESLIGVRSLTRLGAYDGRAMPTAVNFNRKPIVLASDGLFGFIDPSEVRALVGRRPEGVAGYLCEQVRQRHFSLPDDFAAIVVRFL